MSSYNIKRPVPVLTPEQYIAAIESVERAFARNKSRMWVMRCLREELDSLAKHGTLRIDAPEEA